MPSTNMPWSEVLYWAGWANDWPEEISEEMDLCTELADTIDNLTTSLVKIIIRSDNLAEVTKWVSDVQAASAVLRRRQKDVEETTHADFEVLAEMWTTTDGFALQEGLLALLKKSAEGIIAKAYQPCVLDNEQDCLKIVTDAAQTDRADVLCHYLGLAVKNRPPYSTADLREATKSYL